MRYILNFAFYILPFAVYAQPQAANIRPLYNYDYIGSGELKPGINCFVITDREHFEKFFGKTNKPDTPWFSKEDVLVLLMPATNRDSKLLFTSATNKAGNFVEVYCDAELNKGKLPYKTFPIALGVIPKYKGVKKVRFYDKYMKLMQEVEIK